VILVLTLLEGGQRRSGGDRVEELTAKRFSVAPPVLHWTGEPRRHFASRSAVRIRSSLIAAWLQLCSEPAFHEKFELFIPARKGEPARIAAVFDVSAERSDGEVGVS
jgi:hypothetical protein